MRAPLFGAVIVVGALLFAGCVDLIDHGTTPCTPETCDGCCTAEGACLAGSNVFACGASAGLCRACDSDELCLDGTCRVPGDKDLVGPDGGEGDACDAMSCAGCCADGECVPVPLQTDAWCGRGGVTCAACTGAASCIEGSCEVVEGCRLQTSVAYAPGYGYGILDFGDTPVGAVARIDVTFKNTGDAACDVTAPAFLPESDLNAFSFNGQPAAPFRLEPGKSQKLAVTFTPYAPAEWSGYENAFTFTSNDYRGSECASGVEGCRRVVVQGRGVSTGFTPRAPVIPGEVELGEVTIGCESAWRQVLLVNESAHLLTLTQAQVSGAGFELEARPLPLSVAPWATVTLYLRFVPAQTGPQKGVLTLSDSLGGVRTFELSATGVTSTARTETFLQAPGSTADLLFVVGNGAGMQQLQLDLSMVVGGFWSNTLASGASVRAGVISTDVSFANAGLLQGSPKFVTASTANGSNALSENVRVGTGGVVDQALEAARLALAPPNATDPLRNGGFLRSGARLGLVFVTDSADASPASVDDYVRAFRELVRGPIHDRVRTYAIAPASLCQAGSRYEELVSKTGGLCQATGAEPMKWQFEAIAADLFRQRDEYELSQPIDPGQPVMVFVDTAPAQAGTQFVLDTANNSVHFAANAVPETGQTLSVTYSALCHP